ncbi:Gfo/Idh/MocA family protein [Streptomyces californicus]|uniref:Gfo/Idh/MocA family protein n=1 Tax=Streptomyces californicus TaxID=67351 RepID=UPI001E30FE31|nr:Gfo/Idh/MocA family oxidoreductase [Streptomyces californicus]MCC0575579.1 Gfo/Idh/MocA family oxidoreductase [Streptomyces californicus]
MTGRPFRTALVGFGWINAQVWLPRLLAHRNFEVVGVYDPALTARSGAPTGTGAGGAGLSDGAAGLPPDLIADRLEDLLARDLDLAVVGTPNHLHEQTAGAVLDAGVAALIEKPLCLSTEELRRLDARSWRTGAPFQISRPSARRLDVDRLRSLVRQWCVGPVRINAEWLRSSGVPRPGSWFTRRDQAGGGALLDLGWHLAEVTQGLLPDPRRTSLDARLLPPDDVSAHRGAGWRGDSPAPGAGEEGGVFDVEADGSLRARYRDGSALSLRAAWATDVEVDTTRIEVHGTGADGEECHLELVTTFGFSPHRVAHPVLRARRGDRVSEWPVETAPGKEYDAQLDATLAMLRRSLPWRTELHRSAQVLSLLEDAYRAAGRPLVSDARARPAGAVPC